MSTLSKDDVLHIAKLARLTLTEEEQQRLPGQLGSILGYIDQLREVNTDGVAPTAQVTGTANVLRPDALRTEPLADEDALLRTSALPIVDHQIETPSAHG